MSTRAERGAGERDISRARLHGEIELRSAELQAIKARLSSTTGDERRQLIERCLELHQEVERYLWYLEVEREVGGSSAAAVSAR